MRDVLIIASFFLVLFCIIEWAARRFRLPPEWTRKATHVISALVIAGLPLVTSYFVIAIVAGLFVVVMLISKRLRMFTAIHDVTRTTSGEVYLPLAVCLLALAFPHPLPFTYGILTVGLADAAASIVGQHMRSPRFRLVSATKTIAGSTACAIVAGIIGFLLFMQFGLSPSSALVTSIVFAGILTVTEAALGGGSDNLVITLLAAWLASTILVAGC